MMILLQATEAVAVAAEQAPKTMGLGELFLAGGFLMWPLLILGGVAVFIFFERFWAIRKASAVDMNFMNRIREHICEGRIGAAVQLCRQTNTPIAHMIEKGIGRIGRPLSDVQSSIENVANLEVSKLETDFRFWATIAGRRADDRISGYGGRYGASVHEYVAGGAERSTMTVLASGMYVAMVTTVGGLVVGVPAYFGYNYLVARIEKLVFQMEANSIAFMDILNQPIEQ